MKNKSTSQFIVKSNSLVEARYRLSLQESHVVFWLLTQIKPDDEDFKLHSMKIADFAKMIGVQANSQYKELRKVTMRLIQRGLSIYDQESQEWLQVSWLSAARYKTKQGAVSLEFSPQLKPYLLQLKKQFTKINIVDTFKFKSAHAIRIFELLLQYESIGKRTTTIEELRTWCGIEQDEYADYFDLKRKVINRAKDEINAKTEYHVTYVELKESRKVSSIQWTFSKKTHFEKLQLEKGVVIKGELKQTNDTLKGLVEYGFSKARARKILQDHGEKIVANVLKAIDKYQNSHVVKNPKAMIQTAIKEKWSINNGNML